MKATFSVPIKQSVFRDHAVFLPSWPPKSALAKSDFVVKTDSTGAKFVSKVVDELTKNQKDDKAEEGGIMCAVGGPFYPCCIF